MNLLIKSATIIAPGTPLHNKRQDILIEGETIKQIASTIKPQDGVELLEKPNLHVSIGWMDANVSLGEPGFEERETIQNGLNVASYSGFTAVGLLPDTNPVVDQSFTVGYAKQKSIGHTTDLYPIASFTIGAKGQDMTELYDMQQHGAIGFYDYKKPITNPNLLKMGLLYVRSFNGLLMSFPQEPTTAFDGRANESSFTLSLGFEGSPNLSEELQVARDLLLLEYAEGKLHIPTISIANTVKQINEAKKKGLNISCSVTPHHLCLTDHLLEEYDTRFKVNPPLRTDKDRKAMIKAVKDGVIDLITSDHRPLDIEVKKKEFSYAASGSIGMESLFGALNTVLDLDDFIPCITTNPRKVFNLEIPEIKEGGKANLTLFNPDESYVFEKEHILSTSDNSAFVGQKLKGKVYGVFNKGQLMVR